MSAAVRLRWLLGHPHASNEDVRDAARALLEEHEELLLLAESRRRDVARLVDPRNAGDSRPPALVRALEESGAESFGRRREAFVATEEIDDAGHVAAPDPCVEAEYPRATRFQALVAVVCLGAVLAYATYVVWSATR